MRESQFDVFLSHNSKDKPAVERIAEKLRAHRLEPWLDKWHLPAGKSFQEGIDAGLRASRSCAVFLSQHGPGQWQRAELEVAQDRAIKDPDFTLFLVLLPGLPEPFDVSTLPSFLNMRSWVDLRGGYEDPARFQHLINAIAGIPMGPVSPIALDGGVAPYRGLQVFDEAHAEFFFGREADVQRLLEKLKSFRFLAVVGPSGSGKSSVVRAGLLPALKNGALPGSHEWPARVFTPGARPLAALAAQLVQIDPARPMGRTLDELRESPRTLDLASELILANRPPTSRLVLVIDQFEEIFTLTKDEAERASFLGNVLHATTIAGGRCIVILTMRADFYPRCAAHPDLATLLAAHQVLLGPLSEQGIRTVIVEPARRVGVSFEPGLVDTILGDVGKEPGSLPLLEHALLELWERRQGTVLTLAGYRESGGVGRALATRADTVFTSLDPAEQAVARRVLLRLTQPGEDTEDTRRRAELDELITRPAERETVQRVLDQLVAARLLTTDQPDADAEVQVDVAHEALIRAWPRLRAWLDEDREGLRTHRRLTEATEEWADHQRDPDLLYRGVRLAEAQALAGRQPDLLNEPEQAFLAASVAAREREITLAAERAAAQERQRRRVFAGLAAFSILALLLALLAGWQWRNADAETRRADAERAGALAAQGTAVAAEEIAVAQGALAESERNNAVISATEAVAAQQTAVAAQAAAEAQTTVVAVERNNAVAQATAAAVANATAEARRLEAEVARAEAEQQARLALARQLVAQSDLERRPDVRLLLSLEARRLEPGSVAATGGLLAKLVWPPTAQIVLDAQSGTVWKARFTPDGSRIVTAGADDLIRLWDVATGDLIGQPWQGHQGTVWSVAVSPDGTRVVSASQDGTLILWDIETGLPIGVPWTGHTGSVFAAAFNPDGTRVVSAGQDGAVFLWDVGDENPSGQPLRGLTGTAWTATFSPDGETVIAAGDEGVIVVWETATRQPWGEPWVSEHGSIYDLAYNPDGTRVASGSMGGIVTLWDVASGQPAADPWQVHQLAVYGLTFFQDGGHLISASADETMVVTDTATGEPVGEPWQGHDSTVFSVATDGDERLIASAGGDGAVIVWTVPPRPAIARTSIATNSVIFDMALSPDGSLIGTVGAGEIAIWDAASGQRVTSLVMPPGDSSWAIDFSPDGTHLASGNKDGAITLWDVTSGEPSGGPWPGHEGTIWSIDFSPDGQRLASAGNDGSVILWDMTTGQLVWEPWRGHPGPVSDVAFSRDGTQVISLAGDIIIWDVATGRPIRPSWQYVGGTAWRLALSPDGTHVLLGTVQGTLGLWDVTTGQVIGEPWRGHTQAIGAVAFSPDGERAASADFGGTVALWDVASGREFGVPWPGHAGAIYAVTFSADGAQVVSAGDDGVVTIWDASEEAWQAAACHVANRNLTRAEWERFLPGQPYHQTCPHRPIPPPADAATPVSAVAVVT